MNQNQASENAELELFIYEYHRQLFPNRDRINLSISDLLNEMFSYIEELELELNELRLNDGRDTSI